MVIIIGIIVLLTFTWQRKRNAIPNISFSKTSIGADPDAYIQAAEHAVAGIRRGAGKRIVWHDEKQKQPTRYSLVYIHGFSASANELQPLPETIATALGANCFYTRLTGHGIDGTALGTATVDAWLTDVAEAIAIGETIGKHVIVLAASTGASLLTTILAQPIFRGRVTAAVLISPNYGLKADGAFLLNAPFARQIARMVLGKERASVAGSDLQRQIWDTSYPTDALLPMAHAVSMARHAEIGSISTPALFLYSPRDQVVEPVMTLRVAARWGGNHTLCPIENTEDPNGHVLAGDAYSPSSTRDVADTILAWLSGVLRHSTTAPDGLGKRSPNS
nr:alpha/beta hydrolase [Rhizobium setariae]